MTWIARSDGGSEHTRGSAALRTRRRRLQPRADRVETRLPISGFRVVMVHQPGGRVVVELRDTRGALVDVVSSSPLGLAQVRGARHDDHASIVFGRTPGPSRAASVARVRFLVRRGLWSHQQVCVPALVMGRFWVAETAGRYTRAVLLDAHGATVARARVREGNTGCLGRAV